MTLLKFVALGGVLLFVYSYLIYPFLLAAVGAIFQLINDFLYVARGKKSRRAERGQRLPRVAVVIAAYNEQKHIKERVHNLLEQGYPSHLLNIYVGSDGSDDGTSDILKGITDSRFKLIEFSVNRGKASVLNDLVAQGDEEILVFSDANTFFSVGALENLVLAFEDRSVGCVSGELQLVGSATDNQDGLYWRVEQFLKFFESRIGGLLGANGAIYAIRRDFWKPLASDTICDDFCVAMTVAASGGRLLYVPAARAQEEMPHSIEDEYRRRIRIGIGNYQALFRHPEYFTRTSWAMRFSYVSHKVIRWVGPHLLFLSLMASVPLGFSGGWWLAWLVLQGFGWFAAWLAYYLSTRVDLSLPLPLKLLAFLFALNWAFAVASLRYILGRYSGSWGRTAR